jgi:sugar O-acyltransferase (sialic acid O-acetyltransferase NeuD family)
MKSLYIFSGGPGGRDLFQLIKDINKEKAEWNVLGYVDTDDNLLGKNIDGINVFHPNKFKKNNNDNIYGICGVQDPQIRQNIVENEIIKNGLKIPILIHPNAVIAHDFKPKKGLMIFSGVNISYNVTIEKYVLISFNCLIGHDCTMGDYSSLLPTSTIDGKCKVGYKSIIGTGVVIHPGVSVGNESIVGIGTVLINNVEDNITVVNMPKLVKYSKKYDS